MIVRNSNDRCVDCQFGPIDVLLKASGSIRYNGSMISWGVSFGSHDAALAVIDHASDSPIRFASHSERFSKKKDDPNLCPEIIGHALDAHGPPARIFYYENPWKKRMRYLRSRQWKHLLEPSPSSVLEKLGISAPVIVTDHHHSHAAAGYFTSGFDDAAVVVVDAIGEMTTLSIWEGVGSSLRRVYAQDYPHSLGLFYSAMAQAAGFKPNGEEYIFMGMAAYGSGILRTDLECQLIRSDDGNRLFSLRHNLHRGARVFLSGDHDPHEIAAASQQIYENCLRKVMDWAWQNIRSTNLVLMGGCALNCVANSKIRYWHHWHRIWIMPNPGDAGSSIGAVLAHWKKHVEWPGPYLGHEIPGGYPISKTIESLCSRGMAAVANGRAEFGPRALGNRSIFADPRMVDMKDQMNWLKKRELFRPFAGVVQEHLASDVFAMGSTMNSPYMQYVFAVKDRDIYPGITHVDGTCRIQTVNRHQHPGLFDLLTAWQERTGCPVLINTSLNIKNQPLVNDEHDAKEFMQKYEVPVLTAP